MGNSVIRRIHVLRQMSVADLRTEWLRTYGEPARSRNRDYLWKRLAWRVQERAYGGVSDRARARIEQLIPDGLTRVRTPDLGSVVADPAPVKRRRDPRLPVPGTVITKTYKGRELCVVVRVDGLELDGTMYPSATALAKTVTGSKSINGWLFLGIAKRRR